MESNLPAAPEAAPVEAEHPAPAEREAPSRPLSVALLPLALVSFIILAFIIAAWTFLAAT